MYYVCTLTIVSCIPIGRKKNSFRILVDRLWPRGLSKDKVKIDLWQRDIAPSNSLRKLVLLRAAEELLPDYGLLRYLTLTVFLHLIMTMRRICQQR